MALPANTKVMFYNPTTKSYDTIEVPHSLRVRVVGDYRWHFSDMDSDSDIYLDDASALEVEAGYQAWRQYYMLMYNPQGQEGTIPEKPPKEVHVRQGWYSGKEYSVSFDSVTASRASKNAIKGRHIEVYQQNLTTGFMRTLIRSPPDSVAKPYSGLQVDTKICTAEGGLNIRIDVAAGQSFFGYRYERTIFIFKFSPEERELAARVVHCCEDQELFSLEVARNGFENHIFPPAGAGRAVLVLKQATRRMGLEQKHWERHVASDERARVWAGEFGLLASGGKSRVKGAVGEDAEGEPDGGESHLLEEKESKFGEFSVAPCKFDLYSYIRNCPCRRGSVKMEDCQHRALFDRFHVDEESRREYEEFHFGNLDMSEDTVGLGEAKGFVKQMCEWRDGDVSYAVLSGDGDQIKRFDAIKLATGVCKDALYNKLVNCAKKQTPDMVIVTAKVSRGFAEDEGEEGDDVKDGEAEEDFVTFIAVRGRVFVLDQQR